MSKSKKHAIENATDIIEKFGGIRPMSAKINVAVTTIQGWKKRDVIPAGRKAIILESAAENDIDLSEFFVDAPTVDVVDDIEILEEKVEAVKDIKITDEAANKNKVILESNNESTESEKITSNNDFTEIAYETEKKAITKSALIAAAMVLLVIGAVIAMLLPDFEAREKRISDLEGSLSDIKNTQSSFKGLVPENWSEQLSDLKQQVKLGKQSVDDGIKNIQEVSKEFIAANNLEDRAIKLQTYVSEIASENGIYRLLSRFNAMENSVSGKRALDRSVLELSSLFSSTNSNESEHVNSMLSSAISKSAALTTTLGSVPQNDMKAAALLLAMTQVRSALNRNDGAFEGDLNLLMNMIGEDNVELRDSLERLAPHSKSGVLSASGLQKEFRSIAGDVVAASLQGEDVSFSDRASARMNDVLQIEKGGELITGTKTQNVVQKADKMIATENFNAALGYLNANLNSQELRPLASFINNLEASIISQKVKKEIEQAIDLHVGSGYLGGKQLLSE